MTEEKLYSLDESQREFAKSIYNGIWGLLEKPDRSANENEIMLLSAFASLYHWKQFGSSVHFQRGYWMISRVYQALGDANQALYWAKKCQAITDNQSSDMEDFDLAFAQEGLARAYALSEDLEKAKEHYQKAVNLGEAIQGPEDKKIFQGDLNSGGWFGLN